jgi:hypothetical protein
MTTQYSKESLKILSTGLFLAVLAVGSSPGQFETRASISTGALRPLSLVAGDFNRDGKLDVALIGNNPAPTVMIFLGNGDGTFREGSSYSVGVAPEYAAAANLRKSGILDLVVGDSLSDSVYVMLGNGDGTFQRAVAYPTAGRPVVVSVGDFTGDGNLDIIGLTGNGPGCNCIEVLPGNGDGTFEAPVGTSVPYDISGFGMSHGDFDGDGVLDVAVSGGFGAANQVDILLGNGDGSFRAHDYYPVGLAPDFVIVGHFRSSSKVDLAVGNAEGPGISVLLGNGNGAFRHAIDYDEQLLPTSLASGDLNDDGKEDLVAPNFSIDNPPIGSIDVILGNGDGTFQSGMSYPAGEQPGYALIGDFNGDHKPDLEPVS